MIKTGVSFGRPRYSFFDLVRGITLVSMIIYHAVWDMVYLFGLDLAWYHTWAAYYWQQSICWSFIFLSGFCQIFSRSGWRRGLQVLVAGLAVSFVTMIFMPHNYIIWGILTLLGSCMLLVSLMRPMLAKINAAAGLILSIFLFSLLRNIAQGYIGFSAFMIYNLPDSLYINLFTAYLGFPYSGFHSADYFGLLPWLFLYTAGFFAGRFTAVLGGLKYLQGVSSQPLVWLGRNSLAVYLLHQPLIYGILYLYFG